MILLSLSGEADDEMLDRCLTVMVVHSQGGALQDRGMSAAITTLIRSGFPKRGQVLRRMWQTPRGLKLARGIALGSLPFRQSQQSPVFLFMADYVRLEAYEDHISDEEEEMVWAIGEDAWAAYEDGSLSTAGILQIGMAWTGVAGRLGWAGAAEKLEPSLRGRMAYVLGRMYARRDKMDDATRLLDQAVELLPADSLAGKAAKAERERLKGKE